MINPKPKERLSHELAARRLERPARAQFWLMSLLFAVVAISLFSAALMGRPRSKDIRITSGPPGGVWYPLAQAMAEVAANQKRYPSIGNVSVLPTGGHRENLKLLLSGKADFAFFIQSTDLDDDLVKEIRSLLVPPTESIDSPAADVARARLRVSAQLRVAARLHEEILQVVVQPPADRTLPTDSPSMADLQGARVGVGSAGSGTEQMFRQVFDYFTATTPSAAENPSTFTAVRMPHEKTVEAFQKGELDAVAIAAGLHADIVETLLRTPRARLLSLGPTDPASRLAGFAIRHPQMQPRVIPAALYGPAQALPASSIGTRTLLVTRADVSSDVVRDFVRAVFENRSALMDVHEAAALFDNDPPRSIQRFPWHAGALAYYDRNAPSWLVSYAELMNFALGLVVALGSLVWVLNQWRRQTKKNRIDVYYLELAEIAEEVNKHLPLHSLEQVDKRLHAIRRRAFTELVAEKLDAGSSFLIFQQFLNAELENVDRLKAEQSRR